MDRLSESVRVKGEYVPVEFVESRLRQIPALGEVVLWRLDLPAFMRPASVIVVESLPIRPRVKVSIHSRLASARSQPSRSLVLDNQSIVRHSPIYCLFSSPMLRMGVLRLTIPSPWMPLAFKSNPSGETLA